jgi:hypothetical protein
LTIVLGQSSYDLGAGFAVGDFDGDGANDLALQGNDYWAGEGGRGVVHLLRGPFTAGDGPLRDLADRPAELTINGVGNTASSFGEIIRFGGLNQDGREDLLVSHRFTANGERGAAFVFFGREFGAEPAEWNLADTPADAKVVAGDDNRFSMFGGPLAVGDYDNDGAPDLMVADTAFGANCIGAFFFIRGARLTSKRVIDLTEAPADLTLIGQPNPSYLCDTFSSFALAAPTADSGASLWFADADAVRASVVVGEVWGLSSEQLLAGPRVIQLGQMEPAHRYYGTQEAGYGRMLLMGTFDANADRDLVVSSNLLMLPADGGKYRGAAFVYFDQLPPEAPADDDDNDDESPPPDDDETPDDDAADDDDDAASPDDDDNDDDSGGCGGC